MAETKKCENCDAVIGKDEKSCPACKIDLEGLEESLANLETLEKIRDKRRAAAKAQKDKDNPPAPPKKKGLFSGLKRG